MSNLEALGASLGLFCEQVNANARLRTMNKDWSRVIEVLPTDAADAAHTVVVSEGELSLAAGTRAQDVDIRLYAPLDVLEQLFRGEITPTEPYMDGTLRIEGSQEDVLRIDFMSLMIWGE